MTIEQSQSSRYEDAVVFLPDGTTCIQNLAVPVPRSISVEAAEMIRTRNAMPDATSGMQAPIETIRAITGAIERETEAALLQRFPCTVERRMVAGVPVQIVTPERQSAEPGKQLLLNAHAGAQIFGQGAIWEAIPIAGLSGVPVMAVDYRLAPENPFPASLDDIIAVYQELLKTRSPGHIALYGSSAGAALTGQSAVRMRRLNLPLPAALGFFSATANLTVPGDTEALFGLLGFATSVTPIGKQVENTYRNVSLNDPVVSPVFSDLTGFPPTLCMSGTRDFFLSGTCNFHRALLRAGVKASLVVFDAMPHIHWNEPSLPESEEAWRIQAAFLSRHLDL